MKHLKELRELTGRGQYWLAQETGIERSKISLLENRRIAPTEEEKAALEKALLTAMRENLARYGRLTGSAIHA